jgi:hypothetical protein
MKYQMAFLPSGFINNNGCKSVVGVLRQDLLGLND